MLPASQCLITWKVHRAHNWAYTSTGGGHMVRIGSYTEKGYAEHHCPGLSHVGAHRGTPRGMWDLRDYPRGGTHAGPYQHEFDVDTGPTIG